MTKPCQIYTALLGNRFPIGASGLAALQNRSSIALSEGPRRHAHAAREKAAEVRGIVEAQIVRDLGDGHGRVAQLALGLEQQPQVHEVDRRLSCYREAGAAKPTFGGLQQGGILGESGMLAEALLHLLPKARDEL